MTRTILVLFFAFVGSICISAQFCSDLPDLDVGHLVKVPKGTKANPSKVISFYLETDLYTRNELGSDAATEQWLQDLYLEMAQLYGNEGISTALTETYWPANVGEDWSNGMIGNGIFSLGAGIITLLKNFGVTRQNDPDGRLKHFVSMGGIREGVAWVGVLQSNYLASDSAGAFGVSLGMDLVQSTWNKIVLVHESGHNIGSPHTHRCFWGDGNDVIDRCQSPENCQNAALSPDAEDNTIMSYCDDTQSLINGFGVESGDFIRGKVTNAITDLTGGHCAKITYIASNIAGNYYATEDVIFHPGLDSDGMCVFIGCP